MYVYGLLHPRREPGEDYLVVFSSLASLVSGGCIWHDMVRTAVYARMGLEIKGCVLRHSGRRSAVKTVCFTSCTCFDRFSVGNSITF